MKQLSKILLYSLALAILFFATSCEKDLNEDAIQSSKKTTIKEINFNQLVKDTKFKNLLEKVSHSSASARTAFENQNGFTISDTNVKVIESDSLTSYTMLIQRDNNTDNSYFENLVIQEDIFNNQKAFIIKYTPSEITPSADNSFSFNGTIQKNKLAFTGFNKNSFQNTTQSGCYVDVLMCNNDNSGGIGEEHIAGPRCERTYIVRFEVLCDNETPGGGNVGDLNGDDNIGGNNSGGNNNTGNPYSGSGNPNEETNPIYSEIEPEIVTSPVKKPSLDINTNQLNTNTFFNNLSPAQQQLAIVNVDAYNELIQHQIVNRWSNESEQFAEKFIISSIENGLNFDFQKSLKSPANIDFSEIDTTTPEEQKLDCVYKKLMQSTSFKNLVDNTFGISNKINLKFEIVQNLTHVQPNGTITYPNGTSQLNTNLAFGTTYYNNTIQLSGNNLLSAGANKSNFEIAKTIIHEIIHAYLNIKRKGCSAASIPEINSHLFPELISSFYTAGCSIDVNNTDQSEHAFMFDHMIPAFQMIFAEIRDILATPNNISEAEGVYYDNNDQPYNWNWQDFYKYFSMNGLHNNNAFTTAIISNPSNNFLYAFYVEKGQQFSKTCN